LTESSCDIHAARKIDEPARERRATAALFGQMAQMLEKRFARA
jgi:hypothetical protein